ncbi:MAG TPA: amidohydrolase family protein [Sphingomicrobium sp.]|nr:amidohydrolase family protein [Sphingomicrobium sp.]
MRNYRNFAAAMLLASGWQANAAPVPIVDHHQHLLSPAGADLVNPKATAIAVPSEIGRLLEERARRWEDKAGLAKLYTDDALIFGGDFSGWLKGPKAAADFFYNRFARAYRMTPSAYRGDDKTAGLGGYYTRAAGDGRHIGYFSMTLVKAPGGEWRIASETPMFPGPRYEEPVTGANMVKLLDEAGIRRAIVLSNAQYFDSARAQQQGLQGVPALVRAENDWTAAEAERSGGRLIAFCSFNPLLAHALPELKRCAEPKRFKGLKLHFETAGVDLLDADHAAKLRAVFAAANRYRLPILVHAAFGGKQPYGAAQAQIFVDQLWPAARSIPVVMAHLWGGGGFSDEALKVYADTVSTGQPQARNLYFEVAQTQLVARGSADTLQKIAMRIRQIGLGRVYYGSDGPQFGGQTPAQAWKEFREKVPLTPAEHDQLAGNIAPFLR